MRGWLKILVVAAIAVGGVSLSSGSASAAIRANDDVIGLFKVGNRVRVTLNSTLLFKMVKYDTITQSYKFSIRADQFLANDTGQDKRMRRVNTLSQIRGISLTVRTSPQDFIRKVTFFVRPDVVLRQRSSPVLTD